MFAPAPATRGQGVRHLDIEADSLVLNLGRKMDESRELPTVVPPPPRLEPWGGGSTVESNTLGPLGGGGGIDRAAGSSEAGQTRG